ncbi:MAG: tetratricopeptide repeat protein [Pseudomonadota bacterium]
MKVLLASLAAALPLTALACPDWSPASERLPEVFADLAATRDELAAQRHADRIWQDWTQAPDARAQDLLDAGMRRIRASDFTTADAVLSDLITYCPGYAEGWNQRAFARFLQGRHDAALADIDEVLLREPHHFGALSGRVRIFLAQGRVALAQRALADALAIHPLLNDRFLLRPGTKT